MIIATGCNGGRFNAIATIIICVHTDIFGGYSATGLDFASLFLHCNYVSFISNYGQAKLLL